jgi:hypothetical protein
MGTAHTITATTAIVADRVRTASAVPKSCQATQMNRALPYAVAAARVPARLVHALVGTPRLCAPMHETPKAASQVVSRPARVHKPMFPEQSGGP